MELPPGYKDKYYQNLTRENQQIVKLVGYPYDLPIDDPLFIKFKENERILGMYLLQNYSDKFRILKFYFPDIEPIFKFNMHWEDMINNDNSQLLENSSIEIKQIWHNIQKSKYKPQLNDIVRIYCTNTQDNYYQALVFFVGEDGVFVTDGAYYVPDVFYDLLERLGLGEDFDRYIYRNSSPSFRKNKWPYTVTTAEKIK